MKTQVWSVVLAAGAGRRLSVLTGGTPKQFWRPQGGPSLVETTLDRLVPLCAASQTVVVVGNAQRRYLAQCPVHVQAGHVVFQPENRGTAAGILFGLLPVLLADPAAVVLLTPSDHGVENDDVFQRGVRDAVAHVRQRGDVVLFGVAPTAPEPEYGWVTLRGQSALPIRPVASFVEKPAARTAGELFSSGALWNTMILAARATDLLELCRRHVPELTSVFSRALTLAPEARAEFLAACYPMLPVFDFSRDVLARDRGLFAYTWPASMGWSDLGTPERLHRWTRRTADRSLHVQTLIA